LAIVNVALVDRQPPEGGQPFCQQKVKGPVPVGVAVNVAVPPTQTFVVPGAILQVGSAAIVTLCCGEALTLRLQTFCAFGSNEVPLVNWNVNVALPAAISAAVGV
jgi:hypothetical protein